MTRAIIALFLAPFVVGSLFGSVALFDFATLPRVATAVALMASAIMLVVTIVFALPLFIILRRFTLLQWWHATLAGGVCGGCYVFLEILTGSSSLDWVLSQNNLLYVGLGALTGFVFWWIGIFRNAHFDYVPTTLPWASLLLLPIAFGGVLLHQALKVEPHRGRVLAVTEDKPTIFSDDCIVSVRLSGGQEILADFWGCDWSRDVVEGKCFHLTQRWSTFRFRRIYEVSVGFGGGVDDC